MELLRIISIEIISNYWMSENLNEDCMHICPLNLITIDSFYRQTHGVTSTASGLAGQVCIFKSRGI